VHVALKKQKSANDQVRIHQKPNGDEQEEL
jgi:hypothetical protein